LLLLNKGKENNMSDFAAALVMIFCTPFGWIGLLAFGLGISLIFEAKKGK
jgi:hypothetical protein